MVSLNTKQEIKEALLMPYDEFQATITAEALKVRKEATGDKLFAMAMLGYTNHCKNLCLYCGMRAAQKIPRYRIMPDEALKSAQNAKDMGLQRIFLIAGEDKGYKIEDLLKMITGMTEMGFQVSLAGGEFDLDMYKVFKDAGVYEYILKYEMSHEDTFNRLNPSTTFKNRMKAIETVAKSGMKLATGNIVDYPGQSMDELIDDMLLTKELGSSWAPVIPYSPAKGTPLAEEGGRGSLELSCRQISITRIMLPNTRYTAQHPGPDPAKGVSDPEGNLMALNAGADTLFVDLLPAAQAQNFSVIDNRIVLGLEHAEKMAEKAGMNIYKGKIED